MSKTVSIYQQTPDGMLRLGLFTPRKFYSVRSVAEQFRARHPDINGPLFMSNRMFINGRWVDDTKRIPLEEHHE